jgi:hypothetical protein
LALAQQSALATVAVEHATFAAASSTPPSMPAEQ